MLMAMKAFAHLNASAAAGVSRDFMSRHLEVLDRHRIKFRTKSDPNYFAALQGLVTIKSFAAGQIVFKENERSQVLQMKLRFCFVFGFLSLRRQPGRVHPG
jgi:peroxiredoxin